MSENIITSSLLIGMLIVMRRLCRNRISRRLQYALWLLAAVRLLMPVTLFENPFNIMNRMYPAAQRIAEWAADSEAFSKAALFLSSKEQILHKNTEDSKQEVLPIQETTGTDQTEEQPFTQHIQENSSPESSSPDLKASVTLTESCPLPGKPGTISERESAGSFSLEHLLRIIWYTGMTAMAVWTVTISLLYRLRLSRKRKYLGREGLIRIYVSENAGTPCLTGILYPVIYLTPGCVRTQKHLEYAIAHELTHYRHGDHIWTFVRSLCLITYWFHPLVWIGVRLAARDCELACDEGVLRLLGENRAQEYGCTLIEMAASFRRPWMFSCETSMASGKRELKERIAHIAAEKKHTGLLTASTVMLCCAMSALCTFGKAAAAPAIGRYVETAVKFTGTAIVKTFPAIAQEGNTIRLIAHAGFDLLSSDGGSTFEAVKAEDMPQGTVGLYQRDALQIAGSTNGARIFQAYRYSYAKKESAFDHFLITESGKEIPLEIPEENYTRHFYSHGSFFAVEETGSSNRYYKINPITGETQFLTESAWKATHAAADENMLYLANESGVLLFDLNMCDMAPLQDQVLSDFVAENASLQECDGDPSILYPYRDGVYILTHSGLYWHELYGESIEPVIDGNFCTMSDSRRIFTGMALIETEAEPDFLILYDRKELMRYTYDATLPAVPEEPQVK